MGWFWWTYIAFLFKASISKVQRDPTKGCDTTGEQRFPSEGWREWGRAQGNRRGRGQRLGLSETEGSSIVDSRGTRIVIGGGARDQRGSTMERGWWCGLDATLKRSSWIPMHKLRLENRVVYFMVDIRIDCHGWNFIFIRKCGNWDLRVENGLAME